MPIAHPILEDPCVRLEPLAPHHAPGLLVAADPETFRWMPTMPHSWDESGFEQHVRELLAIENALTYAVVCKHDDSDTVVGTTSYLDIQPAHRSLEIGWTWLGPAARGTRVNPSMKRLMLTHALESGLFDGQPAIRVTLKTDVLNVRSEIAMQRLGFVREGVLRHHRINHDGRVRDSVYFSVIPSDWPEVRATLDEAIKAQPAPKLDPAKQPIARRAHTG